MDTLRLVCALVVVWTHFPFHSTNTWLGRDTHWELALRAVLNNFFCGPAAVIVFFVISGFCIHFQQRNGGGLNVRAFYAQRFLRIGIPFAVAVAVGYLGGVGGLQIRWESFRVGTDHRAEAELGASILWSLVAEMVYYALYPLLRLGARRVSWTGILAAAWLVALAILMTDPRARYFPHFGNTLTPFIGLPCWLLGVVLAERFEGFRDQTLTRQCVWGWRVTVWVTASTLQFLFFHPPGGFPFFGYPWTLQFFGVLAFFWLQCELSWWQSHSPPRVLEWGGGWSYSIYLMHVAGPALYLALWRLAGAPAVGYGLTTLGRQVSIFAVSYVFFRLIEAPSLRLARRVGARIRLGTPPPDSSPAVLGSIS